MHLVQIATLSGSVSVGFIVAAVVVLAVMIGFFVVRLRQHRREVRAGQITSVRRPNPKKERES